MAERGRHLALGSMRRGLQEMVNIGSPDYFNSDRNSSLRRRRSGFSGSRVFDENRTPRDWA